MILKKKMIFCYKIQIKTLRKEGNNVGYSVALINGFAEFFCINFIILDYFSEDV